MHFLSSYNAPSSSYGAPANNNNAPSYNAPAPAAAPSYSAPSSGYSGGNQISVRSEEVKLFILHCKFTKGTQSVSPLP